MRAPPATAAGGRSPGHRAAEALGLAAHEGSSNRRGTRPNRRPGWCSDRVEPAEAQRLHSARSQQSPRGQAAHGADWCSGGAQVDARSWRVRCRTGRRRNPDAALSRRWRPKGGYKLVRLRMEGDDGSRRAGCEDARANASYNNSQEQRTDPIR